MLVANFAAGNLLSGRQNVTDAKQRCDVAITSAAHGSHPFNRLQDECLTRLTLL